MTSWNLKMYNSKIWFFREQKKCLKWLGQTSTNVADTTFKLNEKGKKSINKILGF